MPPLLLSCLYAAAAVTKFANVTFGVSSLEPTHLHSCQPMAEPESTMSTADDAAGEEPEVTKAPPSLPPRPPSFSLHSAAASTDVVVDTKQIDAAATPVTVQAEAEKELTSADVPAAIVVEARAETDEVVDSPARSSMPFGHDAGEPTEEEIEKMR
jgi:hypothetical protein